MKVEIKLLRNVEGKTKRDRIINEKIEKISR
jgi:hypothetical protein